MKTKEFKRAIELAKILDFEEIQVSKEIFYTGFSNQKYYENYFIVYLDDQNGTYSIELRENDKYYLLYDDAVICLVNDELSEKLDNLRESILYERESENSGNWSELDLIDLQYQSFRENF